MATVRASAGGAVVTAADAAAAEPPTSGGGFVWKGAKIVPALLSVAVGVVVKFIVPCPAGVLPEAWTLLAIFLSTITGLVLTPLPVGAWAFCGLSVTVVTKTLTFQQAFSAMTNDVIWLIVLAFFFAKGFVQTGLGDRIATFFVKILGKSTLGLSYGLTISEALLAPAMPSTTARAGGVYLPIIKSLVREVGFRSSLPSFSSGCHRNGHAEHNGCLRLDVLCVSPSSDIRRSCRRSPPRVSPRIGHTDHDARRRLISRIVT